MYINDFWERFDCFMCTKENFTMTKGAVYEAKRLLPIDYNEQKCDILVKDRSLRRWEIGDCAKH